MPGLDGLRAIAVAAVVVYHLGASWLPGGLLGVGVFFTLSGYLITDLLLGEHRSTGRVGLRDFWLRRARRLLPALFLMLAVVVVWGAVGDPHQLGVLRGEAISAAFYVNNWWLIFHHVSYFARFGPPAPLGHLWSLAVEEQFYLLWPWLLLFGLHWLGRRPAHASGRLGGLVARRGVLVALTLAAALASAAEMALLYHPSLDPSRIYDGTDTRAFGLLFGAALAMVWPSRALGERPGRGRLLALDAVGLAGLAGIVALMVTTGQYSPFLYRGGMVLLSLATVAVLLAASHPSSRFGKVLGCRPLRSVGLISYGIYLWHYPVIVLTTPTVTHGNDALRAVVQVAAVLALATLSWRFVETPIRHGALGRLGRHLQEHRFRVAAVPARAWVAATAALAAMATGSAAMAGALPVVPAGTLAAANTFGYDLGRTIATPRPLHVARTNPARSARTARAAEASQAPTTSCTSVVHIGDSTSESLVSSDYLDPSEQLPAQYGRVGVKNVTLEISGARSLVETLPGQQNGYQVAQQLLAQGYHGCWVIALGTNDAANIAAGSPEDAPTRIRSLMNLLQGQPVLWINVVSELSSGPYAESSMQAWNQALLEVCPQYSNMKVLDWASMAQPSWFVDDGIHYNSTGSAYRAAAFADGLAEAFPSGSWSGQGPSGCLVR